MAMRRVKHLLMVVALAVVAGTIGAWVASAPKNGPEAAGCWAAAVVMFCGGLTWRE